MNIRNIAKRALRRPANMILGSSTRLSFELRKQFNNPSQSAKFFAAEEGDGVFIHPKPRPPKAGGLPIPPRELWEGYGESEEHYLETGAIDARRKLEHLGKTGFTLTPGMRVLDFGCAAGRVLRHFERYASECEIWGVDLSAKGILWCQDNLSPPFRFVTTTTFPHLPFEDQYFDLIYCDSVFTHITGLAEMWLMELRRILTAAGRLYVTIHDKQTIDAIASGRHARSAGGNRLLQSYREMIVPRLPAEDGGFAMATIMQNRDAKGTQVLHNREWLIRHWAPFMEVINVVEEAYGYQTALIMQRPRDGQRMENADERRANTPGDRDRRERSDDHARPRQGIAAAPQDAKRPDRGEVFSVAGDLAQRKPRQV